MTKFYELPEVDGYKATDKLKQAGKIIVRTDVDAYIDYSDCGNLSCAIDDIIKEGYGFSKGTQYWDGDVGEISNEQKQIEAEQMLKVFTKREVMEEAFMGEEWPITLGYVTWSEPDE